MESWGFRTLVFVSPHRHISPTSLPPLVHAILPPLLPFASSLSLSSSTVHSTPINPKIASSQPNLSAMMSRYLKCTVLLCSCIRSTNESVLASAHPCLLHSFFSCCTNFSSAEFSPDCCPSDSLAPRLFCSSFLLPFRSSSLQYFHSFHCYIIRQFHEPCPIQDYHITHPCVSRIPSAMPLDPDLSHCTFFNVLRHVVRPPKVLAVVPLPPLPVQFLYPW